MESTIKVIGIILIAWLTVLTGIVFNSFPAPTFGVASSIATTDTLNTLRLTTNDLITLAAGFSTTTANTYTALQTFANLTVTTTNTATSTTKVGCVQTYATSTATPIKLAFGAANQATTTFGTAGIGLVAWLYGNCP